MGFTKDNGGKEMIQTIVLIGIILYLGIVNYIERQKATAREEDLLNRLMSKNFGEYVRGRKTLKTKDKLLKDANAQDIMEQVNRIEPENRDVLPVD